MIDPTLLARADRFRAENVHARVFNPHPRPHWIGQTNQFWYRHESPRGVTFTRVDAETGEQLPAFDHEDVAHILSAPDPHHLPIADLDLSGKALRIRKTDGSWYEVADGVAVAEAAAPALHPGERAAPDGKTALFARDHDLWLRDLATLAERRLTHDGDRHNAYGASPEMNLTTITLRRRGLTLPANGLFSPDGTKLFTSRLDERAVLDLTLLQHVPDNASPRPAAHTMKFAYALDAELPVETHCIIDLITGQIAEASAGPLVTGMTTCLEKEEAWWSADSSRVFFLERDRYWRSLSLLEMDAATGLVGVIYTETVPTFIDTNLSVLGLPNYRVLDETNEFIWFSQEDGWAHLYLHDLATGVRKNRITSGQWAVRDLLHVDPFARTVEFLAGGLDDTANPYHRTLCRIGLDGTGFDVLTPGSDDHSLAMPLKRVPRDHIRPEGEIGQWRSPTGRYFVHTAADLTKLPVTEIRHADGGKIATLVTASLAPDLAAAWRWPIPFVVTADDGKTDLFGAMWLPTDFDPAKRYPVIDYIYPGPQRGQLPTVMLTDIMPELGRATMPQAFAELGCIVINVDGRGTPLRSKAFHDESYGKLDDPGMLADHVATLRQLAAEHPWFDISRVGIMGHSGGGYGSVRALLEYPEHFHVAVATSGNHDQRGYSFAWVEKYMGPLVTHPDGTTNYTTAANPPLAANLRGKLLLATGDMDDNVHPALTIQLAAALIAANKDFDFIPLPNHDHTTVWSNPYFLRRAMTFMHTHLNAG